MHYIKRHDGYEILAVKRNGYWKVTMFNGSHCLTNKKFRSYTDAERYARMLSGVASNDASFHR